MRGIQKPWPPQNVAPSNQEARTMRRAEADFCAQLATAVDASAYARACFDALEKRQLRAVLYREQGRLCVYCERRLTEGHPAPRIDHWRPLSRVPDRALDWNNLYLSCNTPATCDRRKGEDPLGDPSLGPELPPPVEVPYERCVGFTSLGELYVRSDAPLSEDQRGVLATVVGHPHTDSVKDNGRLNLNHPALVAARAAAVDSERSRLERDFPDRTAGKDAREQRATTLADEEDLAEYVSIRIGWLRRTLGKHRT